MYIQVNYLTGVRLNDFSKCYMRNKYNQGIWFKKVSSGCHKRFPERNPLVKVVAVIHREVEVDVEVSRGRLIQWQPTHILK